jgi:hypothetical protein
MQQAVNNAGNFDVPPNTRQHFYVHASSYEGAPRAVKGVLQTREPIAELEAAVAYAVHVLESVARAERSSAVNAAVVLTTEPMPINLNREGGFCVVGSVRVGAEHRLTMSIGRGVVAP